MAGRFFAVLPLLTVTMASALGDTGLPESLATVETMGAVKTPAAMQQQQTPNMVSVISNWQAQQVVNAAVQKASDIKVPSNIAIADPFGHLVSFMRMDGAALVSIDVALKKAKTVSMFGGRYRTGDLYNATGPGGALYGIQNTNAGLIFFGGGVPLKVNGQFVGSLGVSGGNVQQDSDIAAAAAAALR